MSISRGRAKLRAAMVAARNAGRGDRVPVGPMRSTRINAVQFTPFKHADGWTVKLGCCHVIGKIMRSDISNKYVFDCMGVNLASQTQIKVEEFLAEKNADIQ